MSRAAPWYPLELRHFYFDVDICTTFNIFIFESTNCQLLIKIISLKLGRLGLCFQKPVEGVTDKCLLPNFRSRHLFTKSFHSIDIKILELYRECYAGPGPIFTRNAPGNHRTHTSMVPQWYLCSTSVLPHCWVLLLLAPPHIHSPSNSKKGKYITGRNIKLNWMIISE